MTHRQFAAIVGAIGLLGCTLPQSVRALRKPVRALTIKVLLFLVVVGCGIVPLPLIARADSQKLILARDAELAATNGNALLVDVRELDEIEHGAPLGAKASFPFRLDGSRNEQFVAEMLDAVRGKLDTKIILICATGVRSAAARDLLLNRGFENVASLVGGFVAWRRERLPIK
jgi:thiosulfate sulfurtransferase